MGIINSIIRIFMGRERKGCRYCVENRMLESLKMNLRLIYSILIWYEFVLWPKEINMQLSVLTTK